MWVHQVRRWQWVAVGALVGLAIGGGRAASGPAYGYSNARTLTQSLFERATLSPPGATPRASKIVVHPPDAAGAYWVTGRYDEPVGPRTDPAAPAVRTSDFKYRAPTPYRPKFAMDAADPARFTVADYLDQVAARVPQAGSSYRYAWEERPVLGLLVWLAGSTLMIGFVWPALLRLLPGAPPSTGPAEAVPPAVRPATPGPVPSLAPAGPRTAGIDADVVLEAYFSTLGGQAPTHVPSDAAPQSRQDPPTPPVRLGTAPLEPTSAPPAPGSKDYRGEYYPTVVHGKESRAEHPQRA